MRAEQTAASRRPGERGLTLIEVMAAVALLGLVYTALASKATQGVMSEGDSLRRFQASLIADEKLAEIETIAAMKQTPDLGRSEDESEDGVFLIDVEVSEWKLPLPPEPEGSEPARPNSESVLGGGEGDPGALLQVRVRISWVGAFGERSIERVTFVLDQDQIRVLAPADPEGADL